MHAHALVGVHAHTHVDTRIHTRRHTHTRPPESTLDQNPCPAYSWALPEAEGESVPLFLRGNGKEFPSHVPGELGRLLTPHTQPALRAGPSDVGKPTLRTHTHGCCLLMPKSITKNKFFLKWTITLLVQMVPDDL